jgi:hypothetical protein
MPLEEASITWEIIDDWSDPADGWIDFNGQMPEAVNEYIKLGDGSYAVIRMEGTEPDLVAVMAVRLGGSIKSKRQYSPIWIKRDDINFRNIMNVIGWKEKIAPMIEPDFELEEITQAEEIISQRG